MSHEAVDTSAIEGEPLDRDSDPSSIRRHLGLAGDRRCSSPAEAGIAEMMVDLYEQAATPLTEEVLFRWHRWITNGRTDPADIGCYRTHADPMQIVSGALHAPKVHFEAPPSSNLSMEMQRFWGWLKRTAPARPYVFVKVDKQLEARLFASALDRLDEAPLRFLSTEEHGSPYESLFASAGFPKALEKIPSLRGVVSDALDRAKVSAEKPRSKKPSVEADEV